MAMLKTKTLGGNARKGFYKKSHGITAVPHVMPNGDIVRALIMRRPRAHALTVNPTKEEAAQTKRDRRKERNLSNEYQQSHGRNW